MKRLIIFAISCLIILACASAVLFVQAQGNVYYIKDGGVGDGSSVDRASGSIEDAYSAMAADGGYIVVCGEYTIASSFTAPSHAEKITFTSVYNGTNYAQSNGAKLIFKGNYFSGGTLEFNHITLESAVSYPSLLGNNYPLTLGEGITCQKAEGISEFLSVMGGSNKNVSNKSADLVIKSGVWQRVRGGTTANICRNYNVNIKIYGGEFIERVTLGSAASHMGEINAEMYGGTFYQGIYAATLTSSNIFSGSVKLYLHGGTYYGIIAPAASAEGRLNGTFNIYITGGEFAHLVELCGSEGYNGNMVSTLSSTVDMTARESGTYTFTNPIRLDGADPWLFYHDGYYYYTSTTSSSSVKLTRVANIGDLIRSSGTVIYIPEADTPWADSTWSPTIVHYTDAEIGEGNGGWYMYFGGDDAADDATDVNHRMYVLKCLDGDDLLGRWGNPLTGELNHPERVTAPSIPGFDDVWAAGQGDIRINGELYTLYVTEEGRGTSDFHQTINIVKMKNPWTIEGEPSVICVPEYDWEMHGYRQNPTTGVWSPKVVEAATPVYADDGSVFIIYSASNYMNPNYCLGQLKYKGGDPTDIRSWEKKPTPILKRSGELCGTGSASYVTDTSGQGWVIYNAYIGEQAVGDRHAVAEPYTASADGVFISSASSNTAAPLSSVYTQNVNPMSLFEKTSGFDKIEEPFFVRYGGTGDGSSADRASGSIADAYAALSQSGGYIVVCGEYTLSSSFVAPSHDQKIVITSYYCNRDFAKTDGAKLVFKGNFTSGGELEFNNISLESAVSYPSIFANNHPLVLGDGICSLRASGISQYLSVMGGAKVKVNGESSSVVIKSGAWQRVRGGAAVGGSTEYSVDIKIYGGEFIERLTLGSSASHSGDINAEIYGGTFYQGIYAATLTEKECFFGDVALTLAGGTYYNVIAPAPNTEGILDGSFSVNITGGEFAHLVELRGSGIYRGNMTSTLNSTVDISLKESGTYTFTNPIRLDGADPCLFYHDGYYYYTSTTSSSTVKLTRATNIGDLIRSGGTAIYTPTPGSEWAGSTLAPRIVHYTDAEMGEGNGGWYMYFSAPSYVGGKMRMYVLKCLDGDELLGKWGNPITGEIGRPEPVCAPDIPEFDALWTARGGDLRIDGKIYTLYTAEYNEKTSDYCRAVNIAEMKDPWTIKGMAGIICVPEYEWEMYSFAQSSNGYSTPMVVESATPVYADDGSIFIVYSANYYKNENCCLGQLKYVGTDPLDMASWEKKTTPILKGSGEICATGSVCFFTDSSGAGWALYNAYMGDKATGSRCAVAEPYTVSADGVVISSSDTNIAAGISSVYTSELNPMPLSDKISGFSQAVMPDYEHRAEYTVKFTDENGDILSSKTYLAWESVVPPADPSKASDGIYIYEFVGWDKKIVACSQDSIYTAVYKALLIGDVDGNGSVENVDITLVIRALAGWESEYGKTRLDMNCDGVVNNRDAIALITKLSLE